MIGEESRCPRRPVGSPSGDLASFLVLVVEQDAFGRAVQIVILPAFQRPEKRPERRAAEIAARLGFGHADVVVAVPDIWLDVETMADLDDVAADFRQRHGRRLRIATKYWRLTQQFFTAKHGIQVYRIVESLGATEGAPAAGSADVIVDITSSGSTLKANHLKVLADGVVLRSQACLVVSRRQRAPDDAVLLRDIVSKVAAAVG